MTKQVNVEKTIEEAKEEVKPKAKRKFTSEDMITVINYTAGTLYYENPRTTQAWTMIGFGAPEQMNMTELISMKSSQPRFLMEPYMLVMDDDAVEQLSLKDVYSKILQPDKINDFYEKMSYAEMEKFLENASRSMKQLIVNLTIDKIRNNELDSRGKIKLIESKLGKDFSFVDSKPTEQELLM